MSRVVPMIHVRVRFFGDVVDVWLHALPHVGDRMTCFFPDTISDKQPLFLLVVSILHEQMRARPEDPYEPEPLLITIIVDLDPVHQRANEAIVPTYFGKFPGGVSGA